jgi:hypothetical protein
MVNVLAIGPKVRGLKLGRGQLNFNGGKNQTIDALVAVTHFGTHKILVHTINTE